MVYYAVAVLVGAVVWKLWRWEGGLLAGYGFLILAETVLIRKPFEGVYFQSLLFWPWRAWSIQKSQILTNVLMFFTVGLLAGKLWKWRGLLIAVGLSLGIEVLQLISRRGLCGFDDVIHNVVDAAVGIGLVMIGRKLLGESE